MRHAISASIIAAVAACGPGAPDPAPWLAGRWAVDGDNCETSPLVFEADGSWRTQWLAGRWTYSGGRLTRTVVQVHSYQHFWDSKSGNPRPQNPPLCHIESIRLNVRANGRDEIEARWADGSVHRMVRCASIRPRGICIGDCPVVTPFDNFYDGSPPAPARPCR